MAQFKVAENMSTSWQWPVGGDWYTMSMRDDQRLKAAYAGGDSRGPTHAEKLELIERLQWETCRNGNFVHVRAPR